TNVEPPALGEDGGPVVLPGPVQKRRPLASGRGHGIPGRGLRGVEPVDRLDFEWGHRSSDGPAVSGDSPAVSPALSPASSPASLVASSTAESKSSPSSSPNSWPIFFMKRATLAGSFSSTSPSPPLSASDSRRASSDLTVANRDMSRVRAVDLQRGHTGAAAVEMLRTSRLTRRRQSWHSYSEIGIFRDFSTRVCSVLTRTPLTSMCQRSANLRRGNPRDDCRTTVRHRTCWFRWRGAQDHHDRPRVDRAPHSPDGRARRGATAAGGTIGGHRGGAEPARLGRRVARGPARRPTPSLSERTAPPGARSRGPSRTPS